MTSTATRVAIVGAGAIARACAALLARAGHAVALWSPSGTGTRDLQDAPKAAAAWPTARAAMLAYGGVVEGTAVVAVLDQVADIASADVVIVALPAPAYASVLPRIAPYLRSTQMVFVSGALSLAPLWLAELAAAQGQRPLMSASGTTVATGRTRDGGVVIMTIRTRLGVAALPVSATAQAIARLSLLFGDRFDAAANVLAVTLT
ncbi:MAG: NAD(P)-binding domain-containing protein, partial [Betaproteobacteria bacterium]